MPNASAFVAFRNEDFRLYEPRNRGDESLNGKRLAVRQKLQAVGEAARRALGEEGIALERRESLHHPFSVNHMRVVAQWTSCFRDAKARREYARAVGPELGKDVDPGNGNLAFFVSIDDEGLQLGLRLGVEAWIDAQNWLARCAAGEAERAAMIEAARAAPGFAMRIHDWETRYPTETFGRDALGDLLKYFKVGEHRLTCARRIGRDDPRAIDPSFPGEAAAALRTLAPLYRFMAWSPSNNRLWK